LPTTIAAEPDHRHKCKMPPRRVKSARHGAGDKETRARAHAIQGGSDSLGENPANTITITIRIADRQSAASAAAAAAERLRN
jgi:hypothetical protein